MKNWEEEAEKQTLLRELRRAYSRYRIARALKTLKRHIAI